MHADLLMVPSEVCEVQHTWFRFPYAYYIWDYISPDRHHPLVIVIDMHSMFHSRLIRSFQLMICITDFSTCIAWQCFHSRLTWFMNLRSVYIANTCIHLSFKSWSQFSPIAIFIDFPPSYEVSHLMSKDILLNSLRWKVLCSVIFYCSLFRDILLLDSTIKVLIIAWVNSIWF